MPRRSGEISASERATQYVGTSRVTDVSGQDTNSITGTTDDFVIKRRSLPPSQSLVLQHMLTQVHGALSGTSVAAELEFIAFDHSELVSVHRRVETIETASSSPEEIGVALARAHSRLADVTGMKTYPWNGFYGESFEFRVLVECLPPSALRSAATHLLRPATRELVPQPSHYVHRDLHRDNVLNTRSGPCLIDWDMTHVGARIDDVAMSLVCLAGDWPPDQLERLTTQFLGGYRLLARDDALHMEHPDFRAAVALSGLRQGVAGTYAEAGGTTASYWPRVEGRLRTAALLLEL